MLNTSNDIYTDITDSSFLYDCDDEATDYLQTSKYITTSDLSSFFNFGIVDNANIMHINCRSLKKNFDSVINLLHPLNNNITAIAFTETWLTPETETLYALPGYNFVCRSRIDKIGGGVGIYINSDFSYKYRKDLSIFNDNIESLFLEVVQARSKFLIGCIYRPPGTDISMFNDLLVPILETINSKRRPLLTFLTGDFNIDLIKSSNHSPSEDFLNILKSFSFLPTITSPTRIILTSATLIDNIFINDFFPQVQLNSYL